MAAPKSTSRTRRNRNRALQAPDSEVLGAAIERERARLMSAESVLHCVEIAMDDHQRDAAERPYYQSAIAVARELINQAVNALDSVELGCIAGSSEPMSGCQVKEAPATYLH